MCKERDFQYEIRTQSWLILAATLVDMKGDTRCKALMNFATTKQLERWHSVQSFDGFCHDKTTWKVTLGAKLWWLLPQQNNLKGDTRCKALMAFATTKQLELELAWMSIMTVKPAFMLSVYWVKIIFLKFANICSCIQDSSDTIKV